MTARNQQLAVRALGGHGFPYCRAGDSARQPNGSPIEVNRVPPSRCLADPRPDAASSLTHHRIRRPI